MPTVHQHHGQTDRQMDRRTDGRTTYDSNTALALRASRGKNSSASRAPHPDPNPISSFQNPGSASVVALYRTLKHRCAEVNSDQDYFNVQLQLREFGFYSTVALVLPISVVVSGVA